jgi:hypothetical protein
MMNAAPHMPRLAFLRFALLLLSWVPAFAQVTPPLERVQGVVWGSATKSIRAGLLVENAGRDSAHVRCFLYFKTEDTNYVVVWVPKPNQRYRVALLGTNNVPVPLTRLGKQLGESVETNPHLDMRKGGYIPYVLAPGAEASFLRPFMLSDYFKVKSPGKYRLEIEPRLYVVGKSNDISTVTVPKVVTEVIVGEKSE